MFCPFFLFVEIKITNLYFFFFTFFFGSFEQIKETNFSLCIVFPKHSINRLFRDLRPSNTAFLYHRWDIASWPGKKCKQFARYATTGKSFFKEYNELFF